MSKTSNLIFDPNSTKNQGRWRLRNPRDFNKMWTEKDKKYAGISYIVGTLYDGNKTIQAIRFDKSIWNEEKANSWWQKNRDNYCKIWTEQDWLEWQKEKSDVKRIKIDREKGLRICRRLSELFSLNYISPNKITIDKTWEKNCLFPVGSIRQGKKIIGDIDVIITRGITKEEIKKLQINNIKEISGGEKRIDFKYYMSDGYVSINVFVFLQAKTWGAALLHSTGPYIYNIRLRNRLHSAKWTEEKGNNWKLSQNGLINNEGKIINTPTERILQKKLLITERGPKER